VRQRLIILALGNFVVGTGSLIIAGILTTLAHDLNVTVTLAGQLVTVYALTYAVAAPLLAAFTSKLPRRTLLIAALLILTGANVIAVLAPNFETLFITRILAALGGALYTPTSSAVAVTLAPPAERGRALALVFAGLPVSTVLGVPLGTFIGSNFGWRLAFGTVVLLGLAAVVAIGLTIKNLTATPPIKLAQWFGLLKQGRLVLVLSITFWQYTAQFMVFTYIAPLLQKNTGLDGTGVSLMLFVVGVAGVIGNNAGGRVADRWNLRRALGFALVGLALSLFILPLATTSLIGAVIILFIWGLIGFIFNPVQQNYLIRFAPQLPGLILSLNSSMLYLGNATGAALGGVVVSSFGVAATGWFGGLIALVGLGVLSLSVALGSRSNEIPSQTTELVTNG
jgi:predicted MFS family arabinose efflux permease